MAISQAFAWQEGTVVSLPSLYMEDWKGDLKLGRDVCRQPFPCILQRGSVHDQTVKPFDHEWVTLVVAPWLVHFPLAKEL